MITGEQFQAMWVGTKFWSVGTVDTEFFDNDFAVQELCFGAHIPGTCAYVEVIKYECPRKTYPSPSYFIPETQFYRLFSYKPSAYEILAVKLAMVNRHQLNLQEYVKKLYHDYGYWLSVGRTLENFYRPESQTFHKETVVKIFDPNKFSYAEDVYFKGMFVDHLVRDGQQIFTVVDLPTGVAATMV